MPGKNIHILEAMDIVGGACDGIFDPSRGYIMRGGREMENHFECLWDLFRSIPSLEIKDARVLKKILTILYVEQLLIEDKTLKPMDNLI